MTTLRRSADDRWIGGVCGGIAERTGMDASIVRILVAAATIIGFGGIAIVYVIAWIVLPDARTNP